MSRFFKYCVVQFAAHPIRGERLNVALAVFQNGGLEIHSSRKLDKLKAMSGALDIEDVRGALASLTEADAFVRDEGAASAEERLESIRSLCSFQLSPMGSFDAPDWDQYNQQLEQLTRTLIDAEPAPAPAIKKRGTALLSTIKKSLRAERVLAKKGEGLEAHRVVANHLIAEGLSADLVLKNGAMHVVEAVDAASEENSLRKHVIDIAVSALVFERARMSFGLSNTKTQLVYQASVGVETAVAPSLSAAEHQGASLVNWASADDRQSFLAHLSSLATPIERPRSSRPQGIHASSQPRLRLN